MSHQNFIFLMVFFFFISLGALAYFFTFGNRGEVKISLQPFFMVDISSFKLPSKCTDTPCTFDIPTGTVEICVQKEAYYKQCKNFEIERGKKISWAPDLKKIPEIVRGENEKEERKISNEEDKHIEKEQYSDWPKTKTPLGKEYVFQPITKELHRIDEEGKLNFLLRFTDLSNVSLLSFEENLILFSEGSGGKNQKEIFFINPHERKKFRISEGKNLQARVVEGSELFFSDEETLFWFDSELILLKPTKFFAPLNFVTYCDKNIFYAKEENDQLTFYAKMENENISQEIVSGNFANTNFELMCGDQKNQLKLKYFDGDVMMLNW